MGYGGSGLNVPARWGLHSFGLGLLTVFRRSQEVGRMKIELFADVVPKTAENFR